MTRATAYRRRRAERRGTRRDRTQLVGVFPLLVSLGFLVVVAGCGAFRLHDEARLKIATEATELSGEIRSNSKGAFNAMEANLDQVQAAHDEIESLLDAQRYATFVTALATMTGEDLVEELDSAKATHDEIGSDLDVAVSAAVASVNATLDRLEQLGSPPAEGSGVTDDGKTPIEKAIDRLDKQLDRFESIAKNASKALDLLGVETEESHERLELTISKLQESLSIFQGASANDPSVRQALELMLESGQEIATQELKRLTEVRRHLSMMQGIREEFNVRSTDFEQQLFVPARRRAEEAGSKLLSEYIAERMALDDEAEVPPDEPSNREKKEAAAKLYVQFGLLLFVENLLDMAAEAAASAEVHRHSVRMSEINAQEGLDLVHQVVLGLQIYYQGGITAEQVAALVLAASQVGALTFIGARV